MSKNTANVSINVINKAQSVATPSLGVIFVAGETDYGIPNNPVDVISSVTQFEKLYGSLSQHSDFPLLCELALNAGAKLRVCKIVGTGATPATHGIENDTGELLATLTTKGKGTIYNTMDLVIMKATNLDPNCFNLILTIVLPSPLGDITIQEVYENLEAPSSDAPPYTWLKPLVDGSKLVTVTYADLTSVTGSFIPFQIAVKFSGGTDDFALSAADYTGSPTLRTGFHSFDPYEEAFVISAPAVTEEDLTGIYTAGKAYAALRKDLVYFYAFANSLNTATDIVTHLQSLTASKYAGAFGGGVKVVDALEGGIKETLSTGELLGVLATSHTLNGPWISPTSYVNGVFNQALGVVNNFGSPASLADLNLIANAGGNMVVNKSGTIMQWDFYTMDTAESPEKFLTIMFLEIYLRKSLKPILERFLGRPNTFGTWEEIYYTVLPFLINLVDQEALFEFKWDGDQFAKSLDDLQINDPDDVGLGKYKIQLQIKTIAPMVEITLDIILTKNSVEFE